MQQIIKINDEYLVKFPRLNRFIQERTNVECYAIQVDSSIEGIVLFGNGRLYYIYVKVDSRGGGFGRSLLKYAIAHGLHPATKALRTTVDQDDIWGLKLLLSEHFKFIGFHGEGSSKQYLLEYKPGLTSVVSDPLEGVKDELELLADMMYVVEVAPVKIVK